jgi:small-conductance mechanosensitive channel
MAEFLGLVVPAWVPELVQAAAIAVATYVAAWLVRRLFLRAVEHTRHPNPAMRRVGRVLQGIIATVGALAVLAALNIDVSSVLIGLGGVSIAVSFALSTLINNLVSGALILADDSVRPGDTISVGGLQGRVVWLRARATELETAEGHLIFVPNIYLAQNPVVRLSRAHKGG